MPMSFPDMKSLTAAAGVWKFRKPNEGESEAEYRTALADYVHPKDSVESMEIRKGYGWNQFTEEDKRELLLRSSSNWIGL